MKDGKTPREQTRRRDFLKLAVSGTAVGAAAAMAGSDAKAADAPADRAAGYRETDHVRKYYQTACF